MANNPYTTLVSCRIDNKTLKEIDKFCENRPYFNRSRVINQALYRIFRENGDASTYDLLYDRQKLTVAPI